jgi:hypothetical protein
MVGLAGVSIAGSTAIDALVGKCKACYGRRDCLASFVVDTRAIINALYRERQKPICAIAAKYAHFCIFGGQWYGRPQIRLSNALGVVDCVVGGFCFARMGQLLAIYFVKTITKNEWLIAKRAYPVMYALFMLKNYAKTSLGQHII